MTRLPDVEKQLARHFIEIGNNSGRDQRYVRASSVGACARKLGYAILGHQPIPSDAHSQAIFFHGQALHDAVQAFLVKIGWIKARPFWNDTLGILDWEQTNDPLSGCELDVIDHELRVLGHLDGITVPLKRVGPDIEPNGFPGGLVPHTDGERYLVEIKTISDRSYSWILGIRDGGLGKIHEKDKPGEFLELDLLPNSKGKLSRSLGEFSHSRRVISKFGERTYPVHKAKIGGVEELVTVLKQGTTAGQFTSLTYPKDEHIAQASLYASYKGIEKILFLYVGKDVDPRSYEVSEEPLLNFPVKVFEHAVTEETIWLLKDKIRNRVYYWTDQGLLPERDHPSVEADECKYCPFSYTCWPGSVDLPALNERLSTLSLTEVAPGSGVVHVPATNLQEEFDKERPV